MKNAIRRFEAIHPIAAIQRVAIIAFVAVIGFAGCAGSAQPAESDAAPSVVMTLDRAIAEAAVRIDERIAAGSKIALLNFNSPSDQFSSYVLDELTANLLDTGKLTVVNRAEVDLIRSEFEFQFSGDVGDDSMQELGRMLGAQSIVSGSLTRIGDEYRIVIRVLNVQSAAVSVQYRNDIVNDSRVQALLEGGRSAPAVRTTQAAAPITREQPAPAPAPQQAGLRSGTYTFYPRLRATQGGVDVNAYIDRIVIRGEYMNIFLTNEPIGRGGAPAGEWRHSWRISANDFFIQDIDRPTRTWVRVNYGDDETTGGMFLTYQGVTASRFKLTSRADNPHMIFDEIIIGNPD
jgi:TolB-like protein